jgi:hypothetical protein
MKTSKEEGENNRRSQLERARGAFVLRVEKAPTTEEGWKSLRQALRFSRADDAWLRTQVPGAVRRGAKSDLEEVLGRVEKAGHAGCVARRNEG